MSAFLVTSRRVAHRVVGLKHDRHPERVRDVIDGMAREFRLHTRPGTDGGRAIYVPCDLPEDVTDGWVRRYLGRSRGAAGGGAGAGGAAPSGPGPGGSAPGGTQ